MNRLVRRVQLLFITALVLLVAAQLQGCAAANPIAQADTLEQRAYAASGTYNIFQAAGLELIQSGALPDSVSLRLIDAEERATPIVDSLDDALEEFETVKDAVAAGADTQARLVVVSNNLNAWVVRALPLIANLKDAVKGAQ